MVLQKAQHSKRKIMGFPLGQLRLLVYFAGYLESVSSLQLFGFIFDGDVAMDLYPPSQTIPMLLTTTKSEK